MGAAMTVRRLIWQPIKDIFVAVSIMTSVIMLIELFV
jgi:hypothetical protein